MLTIRDRARAIVADLWHLAQPEAMYAVVEMHLESLEREILERSEAVALEVINSVD
jgi:hypothetical protein